MVNDHGDTIGVLDDILINHPDRVLFAVLSVGGFLGVGSREATRAVHDALPLMTMTAIVDILHGDPGTDEDKELDGELEQHGVAVDATLVERPDLALVDVVLRRADRSAAI